MMQAVQKSLGRALIVDDTRPHRALVSAVLSMDGLQCDEASNVETALQLLQKHTYEIVLLDLQLGSQSGLSVLYAIQHGFERRNVPVVVLSAQGRDVDAQVRALRAGAVDVVGKPFHPEVLRARVASALRLNRAERQSLSSIAMAPTVRAPRHDSVLLAARVQHAMLPQEPIRGPSLTTAGHVVPSSAVSGDLFDAVCDSQGRSTAVLMDVVGHGTPAALVASAIREVVRSSLSRGESLEAVAKEVESRLSVQTLELPLNVALGMIRVSADGRRAEVLNAGLPPFALCSASTTEWVPSGSPPIGLWSGLRPRVVQMDVVPEMTFVMVSDGLLSGAMERDAVAWLLELLDPAVRGGALANSGGAVLGTLMREFLASQSVGLQDDATLVVAKVERNSP